jgi:hypothetical protein
LLEKDAEAMFVQSLLLMLGTLVTAVAVFSSLSPDR